MTDLLYPLMLDDGGRSAAPARYWRRYNDCCIRALSIITFIPYDMVEQELKHAGRKTNQGFDLTSYLGRRRSFMGVPFRRVTFKSHTTIDQLFKLYPKGTILLDLDDHTFPIIDGVAHDLIREPGVKPVSGVWRF